MFKTNCLPPIPNLCFLLDQENLILEKSKKYELHPETMPLNNFDNI